MSEAFQSADEAPGGAFGVQAVEVIATEFSVSNRLSEYVIGNDDQPVSHCYYGLLDSAARCNAIEQRSQKGVFGVRGRPSSLAQTASQIDIALAGLAGPAFARTLAVARTQARPTGQMRGIGELRHVQPEFSDERPGRNVIDTGNRAQPFDYACVSSQPSFDLVSKWPMRASKNANSCNSSASTKR